MKVWLSHIISTIHDDPNSFFSQPIECPAAVHASALRLRGPCHPLRADRRWSRASRGGLGFDRAPGDDFDQNRSRKIDFTRNKYLVIPSRNVMGITILGITILGDNMGRFTEKRLKKIGRCWSELVMESLCDVDLVFIWSESERSVNQPEA